jgi:hypothetical protein
MKYNAILKLFLMGIIFISFSPVNFAQEQGKKDQLFYVHEEAAKVSMLDQYEKTSKEFFDYFKSAKLDVPGIYTAQEDNSHYYYLIPISNYADIDKMMTAFNAFSKTVNNENFQKMADENNAAIDYTHDFVLRRSADLSYEGKNKGMDSSKKFIHWDFYTFKPGAMQKVTALAKKFKDLYTAKGIENGYRVWFADLGENNNLVIVSTVAKDAASYYTNNEAEQKKLGKEGDALWEQMVPLLAKFDHRNGMRRDDMMYTKEKSSN